MDKKILLGGAAALLLVGNMYATPASASAIDLSIGGEASVTISSTDECGDTAATAQDADDVLGVADLAALNTKTGQTHTESTAGNIATAGATFTDYSCAGDNDNPGFDFGKELSIEASGTLANGLEISFSDTLDLGLAESDDFELVLSGAFGSLSFLHGAASAVDETAVGMAGEADHNLATDGTAGFGLLYSLPTMGALDVMLSYAPNADGIGGYDDAEYMDTFGIGAAFDAGVATISVGWESASSNDASCSIDGTNNNFADNAADVTAASLVTLYYNDSICGDQTVMAIGAEMETGGMTLEAGYSEIDSDGADASTLGLGVSTTVGDYDIGADWGQRTVDFELGGESDEITAIHVGIETALGDGVDLSMDFTSTETDLFSQSTGAGANTVNVLEVALTVGF